MTGETKNLEASGLDLRLAVAASSAVSECISLGSGVRTNLNMLAARKEDTCSITLH